MKKIMLFLVPGLVTFATAQQESSSITGKVVKTWAGQKNGTFYVIQDNAAGVQYKANTLWTDCAKAEGIFKEAQTAGKDIIIEFQSHKDFTNSIWRIRKIQPLDTNSPAKVVG